MIIHRHSKIIMGGGVCLLIALTGVVATANANVTTTPPTDTIIETRDTAELAVPSTATIDVATPTTAKPKTEDIVSKSTASKEVTSKTSKDKDTTSSVASEKKHDEQKILQDEDTTSSVTSEEIHYVQIILQDEDTTSSTVSEEIQDEDITSSVTSEEMQDENTTSAVASEEMQDEDTTSTVASKPSWNGPVLTASAGIVQGPSGNETYYNLDMSGVISIMQSLGYDYEYWIRDDGVKMYGDYVMCAADLSIRPKGTLIETSLGTGIVCDTGGFVSIDNTRLDIAVSW